MNFASELRLPAIIHDGKQQTLAQIIDAVSTSLELTSPISIDSIARLRKAEAEVDGYGPEVARQLAIVRIAAEPDEVYHLLDGTELDSTAAIKEIEANTPKGNHFAALQKSATLIAIRAVLESGGAKR